VSRLSPIFQIFLGVCALAVVGLGLRSTNADLAMAAVSLLLFVVITAGVTSRGAGVVIAATAAIVLNFFFLPPFGTLHIAGAENWVLFLLFILASLGTSSVVSFARREAHEARKKGAELEAVYRLGVELFSAESRAGGFIDLARSALHSVGARSGALFIVRQDDVESHPLIGMQHSHSIDMRVREAIQKSQRIVIRRSEGTEAYIPLLHDGVVEAVLFAQGEIDPNVIESLGTLLSLAFHRERLHAIQLELSALDESDRAKTAVLRAVAHDLSTPLTALRIQIDTLQRLLPDSPADALETTHNIADEAHRLQRRIRNLLTMARIEAGRYRTLAEPTPVADLFKLTKDSVRASMTERTFLVDIEPGCADALADPALCLEILVNLVENADGASPKGAAIELVGRSDGESRVHLSVRDRGCGPAGADASSAIGDETRVGLGLHIARTFAEMSGGSVALQPRDGGGTIATLELPAAGTTP
jgi:two-component system, OmpR family, sensor histidine kinase KdpD